MGKGEKKGSLDPVLLPQAEPFLGKLMVQCSSSLWVSHLFFFSNHNPFHNLERMQGVLLQKEFRVQILLKKSISVKEVECFITQSTRKLQEREIFFFFLEIKSPSECLLSRPSCYFCLFLFLPELLYQILEQNPEKVLSFPILCPYFILSYHSFIHSFIQSVFKPLCLILHSDREEKRKNPTLLMFIWCTSLTHTVFEVMV